MFVFLNRDFRGGLLILYTFYYDSSSPIRYLQTVFSIYLLDFIGNNHRSHAFARYRLFTTFFFFCVISRIRVGTTLPLLLLWPPSVIYIKTQGNLHRFLLSFSPRDLADFQQQTLVSTRYPCVCQGSRPEGLGCLLSIIAIIQWKLVISQIKL